MKTKPAIEKVLDVVGGPSKLAEYCDVTVQAVNKWRKSQRAPAERCIAIEEATDGEVTRYQLRPDVFGEAPVNNAA